MTRTSLSRQQVADLFGVTLATVGRWVKLGQVTSWLDENGRRRIDAVEIVRFLHPK